MIPTLAELTASLAACAPLRYAAPWDNVGLLLEAAPPATPVATALLTVDLSPAVMAEAEARGAQLVVAYHPPIFGGLKRLRRGEPNERVVLDAARAGISLYSPHTAADAAPGGVNDWLAEALPPLATSAPIEPHLEGGAPLPGVGQGRLCGLQRPALLPAIIEGVKAHLGLAHLRLAAAPAHAGGTPIETVAVCPGAGGGLFERVGPVDLLLTGEMRHHDVLARVARGTSVILTEHTNCERGWLARLAGRLRAEHLGLEVVLSARDRDPLGVI